MWVICDVYENDLATLHLGQAADIHLNAYPDQVIRGTISDIGAVLDPNLRTAKVRIQVENPTYADADWHVFATAVLHGQRPEMHTVIPASAILHLEDRDWVYIPAGNGQFRRVEVRAGAILAGNLQEVMALWLQPGQKVVAEALAMQNSAAQ